MTWPSPGTTAAPSSCPHTGSLGLFVFVFSLEKRERAMSGKDQVSSDSVVPSLVPVPMSAAAFSSLKAQSLGSESTHPSAICTQISVPYQADDHGRQEPALAILCPPSCHARGIPSFGLVHGFGRHPAHISLCSPLKREGVFTSQTQNSTHCGDTKTSRHSGSRGTWDQELTEHRPADF